MSTDVQIDLDGVPPAAVQPDGPLPAHRYRIAGLAVAVLLLLLLAGAAPPSPVVWQRAGAVPADGNVIYEVDGDQLYVSTLTADGWSTSAYGARPFRRLWQVATAADADGPAQLQPAGDQLLLHLGQSTTVLDARSGTARWASPAPVQALPDEQTGFVQEERFRPGTEYDVSSGDPGTLYFSSSGVPHTQPPDRTVVRGVDLATGRQKWTMEAAGSVFAAPATTTPPTVVVVAADRLQLRDADTGSLLRERVLPRLGGGAVAWSEVVGSLVTLRHSSATSDTVGAYALDTLEPRWQRTQPSGSGNLRTCTGVPCEQTPSTLTVLDPLTGAVRWRTSGSVDVVARGPYALEVDDTAAGPRPLRTVDLASGRVGVDLSSWRTYARAAAGDPLVVLRDESGTGTAFGILTPGSSVVRPLGRSASLLADCRSDARLVACRSVDALELWSYRA